MADISPEVQDVPRPEQMPRSKDEEESMATMDVHGAAVKIQRANEAYQGYAGFYDKPPKAEVLAWFFNELCSYFIHTVLIPVVFPLLISQIVWPIKYPLPEWGKNSKGFNCLEKDLQLYDGLTSARIKVSTMKFSPLEWTSISWVLGLILAATILSTLSVKLDYGLNQRLIAAVATAVGALFCLPVGFFKTIWVFPVYIIAIVAANTVCVASHTRHLGLMISGFVGSSITKHQFPDRRDVAGWLSLYATAAGSLGSAIISAFAYHMLRHHEGFLSLWIVSIFSGLQWCTGIIHVFIGNRPGANTSSSSSPPNSHVISIFKYPHAAGSLAGVFLSSFATMCIFTGGVLYLVGQLCFRPVNILYLWLTYFIFPLLSLPLLQPLQHLIRADAVKMQLLGFMLSTLTSGVGFFYRIENWPKQNVLVFAAVQSVATGLLHAFGRVLLLDCSPEGKEGTFAAWFSWVRALGTCTGFAVASAGPGNINRAFGVGFCTAIVGIVILTLGNISDFGGAIAAGHVREDDGEKGSPAHGLDKGIGAETVETPYERIEV
ncbi:hypothetical protein LOK49_LG11G01974 [Camellia lanceoleosa]|uniref:Uncharacterized protein n=1 Tax=Camellia lanceoleosa TaxID=1840588 RepID=A0ACC0G0Q4_9ERIC|nr:hypothetical protein LOK49_LG11G01974 [Camellia lanceoleosa]